MNWLPDDLASFIWGVAVAAIAMIATGFLREAGKELWLVLKKNYFPPPLPEPESVQVDHGFSPKIYAPTDCVWTRYESVSRREADGYTYYPHPSTGGKCVRGYDREANFLMVKPNAKKQVIA